MRSRLPRIAVDCANFPLDRFRASRSEALTGRNAVLVNHPTAQVLLEQHCHHPTATISGLRSSIISTLHRAVDGNRKPPLSTGKNVSYATASRILRMNTAKVTTDNAAKTAKAVITAELKSAPSINPRAALTA